MLFKHLNLRYYTCIFLCVVAVPGVWIYPILRVESAPSSMDHHAVGLQSGCDAIDQVTALTVKAPFSPANSLCVNGSLAVADPDYNRVVTNVSGTGIGNGTPGDCSLSGSGTAVNYDVYSFDLTGCAVFPSEITATLCSPAGCEHLGDFDSTLVVYRNVSAGDPLVANGGLPGVFNPAAACTNARGGNDNLGTIPGVANNPGGATCNQVIPAQCIAPCTSPSNAGNLSGIRRMLGNGRFTLVVSGFGNSTLGTYNLHVDAPSAGCAVALAPTSANGNISGRVTTSNGRGISGAMLTITGSEIAPIMLRTNSFGYYNFPALPVGATYIVSVSSKMYTFANPSQTVNLDDSAADINFVSEQ